MSKEKTNVIRILESKKIKFETLHYQAEEPYDGVSAAHKIEKPPEQVFKTLVTEGKSGNKYVFVIPVDKELDLKKAAHIVNEKSVQMLPLKELLGLTGYLRGGCSPIGMKKLFKTVVHETAKNFDMIYVSGGKRGVQIGIKSDDLCNIVHATHGDIIKDE